MPPRRPLFKEKETVRFRNLLFLLLMVPVLNSCVSQTNKKSFIPDPKNLNDIIICYGDSITLGVGENNWEGEDEAKSYPAFLGKKLSIPVINAGVAGDTTTSALYRLYHDVLSLYPRIVIINLGANDFLSGFDIWLTEHNFHIMLSNLAHSNRQIYITKFYTDDILRQKMDSWNFPRLKREQVINSYNEMYKSLVDIYDVELIDDVWRNVWDRYMSDDIHPNLRGYEAMAGNYLEALRPSLEMYGFIRKWL